MGKRACALAIRNHTVLFPLALMLLITACGVAAPPQTATPTDKSRTPVTLTLWHTQSGPSRTQLSTFAADFNKVYPWITVQVEAKPSDGDLIRQAIAVVALNTPPDVILASPRAVANFARTGDLVPLDLFIDDPALGFPSEEQADFLPGSLDVGRFPGPKPGLFSLPFSERAVVLYYNADALKEAKIPAPPRTWDEFDGAARSTTQGNTFGWAMVPDPLVFYAMVYSRGGSILDDRQATVQFNSDPGILLLQQIAALDKSGASNFTDSATARADFAQGKAAFLFGTTDDLAPVAAAVNQAGNRFRWGVANIPQQDPARAFTALTGDRLAIFRTTPERERAAWLLVHWLGSAEQSARWSRTSMAIPSRLGARGFLTDSAPGALSVTTFANLMDPLPTGRGAPTVKDAASIDQAITEMWTAVANGTAPAAAMSTAVARISRILGQTP